jgi:hypothetical protein
MYLLVLNGSSHKKAQMGQKLHAGVQRFGAFLKKYFSEGLLRDFSPYFPMKNFTKILPGGIIFN